MCCIHTIIIAYASQVVAKNNHFDSTGIHHHSFDIGWESPTENIFYLNINTFYKIEHGKVRKLSEWCCTRKKYMHDLMVIGFTLGIIYMHTILKSLKRVSIRNQCLLHRQTIFFRSFTHHHPHHQTAHTNNNHNQLVSFASVKYFSGFNCIPRLCNLKFFVCKMRLKHAKKKENKIDRNRSSSRSSSWTTCKYFLYNLREKELKVDH